MNYRLELSPDAQAAVRRMPGNMRQRVRRALRELAVEPRPPRSRRLEFPLVHAEPRRLRLEGWRIIYAVIDIEPPVVAVVAIRQRPPYDYGDLATLFEGFLEP